MFTSVAGAAPVYSEPAATLPKPLEIAAPAAPPVATVAAPSVASSTRIAESQSQRISALEVEIAALKRRLAAQQRANARLIRNARSDKARREQARRKELIREPGVVHAINVGAAAYGISPVRLRRIAWCESTYVANARLGPYEGLFQFGTYLWGTTPFAKFDRNDPYAASFAAAWAFSRGLDRHWPICGKL